MPSRSVRPNGPADLGPGFLPRANAPAGLAESDRNPPEDRSWPATARPRIEGILSCRCPGGAAEERAGTSVPVKGVKGTMRPGRTLRKGGRHSPPGPQPALKCPRFPTVPPGRISFCVFPGPASQPPLPGKDNSIFLRMGVFEKKAQTDLKAESENRIAEYALGATCGPNQL